MIRLEEKPFELEGKRYLLRCNMAVLETVEEENGDMEELMKLSIRNSSLELLAAMLGGALDAQAAQAQNLVRYAHGAGSRWDAVSRALSDSDGEKGRDRSRSSRRLGKLTQRAKIDFARYLSIWLFVLHMDEEHFWRRMNPARLHALYDAHFGLKEPAPPAEEQPRSLSEYLRGG